jgi:hypothetical protein
MSAALTAFLLLVIVSALGVWIINRGSSGIEGFDAASRAAAVACEKEYNLCVDSGDSIKDCTAETDKCLKAILNPSVSDVDNAESNLTSSATSAASAKTVGKTITPSSDYTALASAALTGKDATLSSDYEKFLKEVKTKITSGYPKPTGEQLNLAQGAGVTLSESSSGGSTNATYTPLTQRIRPHENLPENFPTMTASASTDKGTGVDAILKDEKKMSSIRQMIRDEIASAVRDELSGSRLFNQYQINYESR